MNDDYIACGKLKVHPALVALVQNEIAPGTDISPTQVWSLLESLVDELGGENAALLARRDDLQRQIDAWLKSQATPPSPAEIAAFMEKIGYLVDEGDDFEITTSPVDDEIATIAGPQLVVPMDNARYALNAANARWGSLFDALYGTDIIPEGDGTEQGSSYNPKRGDQVIARAFELMDELLPLSTGVWKDILSFSRNGNNLMCELADGKTTGLSEPECFIGLRPADPAAQNEFSHLLFKHNNLHLYVLIDNQHPIGKQNSAGVKDVIMESAVSTIMDCEDSVAAVDAADKVQVYANWAAIMKGSLAVTFNKGGQPLTRTLNPDVEYQTPTGSTFSLHGRSLMLVRHVGAHLYTSIVTTDVGEQIPETFIDAAITVLGSVHDLKRETSAATRNSRTGSVYIVKPKQHGPDEVALSIKLFERIEQAYDLPENTLKIGIMDEEKRTTVNLKACIRNASERVIFINTGFLDRTGDEIHTFMEAGAMLPKLAIKDEPWIKAYETLNVEIGLACGFHGRAQIGKGMWPEPDAMQAMMDAKIAHPATGASCAWVPSPTAATLHAIHYHRVNVMAIQQQLLQEQRRHSLHYHRINVVADKQKLLQEQRRHNLDNLLKIPLLGDLQLTPEIIQAELDNNIQGILGYVVRWIEQGVGCSKVLDINDVGLMEDRATLRISSQHLANWLHHGIVNSQQIAETMQRMATVVDHQNEGDPNYLPMAPDFESSIAFQAACELVFEGRNEPNGYTEHLLTRHRLDFKAKHSV